ncbi:MAG: P-II family nitrogen regulator [Myxococcota bacterium]
MQRIEATFDIDHLDQVMRAVRSLRVPCHMTASEVRYADEKISHNHQYRGARYEVPWETRARLEVVVSDKEAESVIGVLVASLDKDRKIDDALLISEVGDALRIRSGRRGEFAF